MSKKNLFSVVVRMTVLVAIIFSIGVVSYTVGALTFGNGSVNTGNGGLDLGALDLGALNLGNGVNVGTGNCPAGSTLNQQTGKCIQTPPTVQLQGVDFPVNVRVNGGQAVASDFMVHVKSKVNGVWVDVGKNGVPGAPASPKIGVADPQWDHYILPAAEYEVSADAKAGYVVTGSFLKDCHPTTGRIILVKDTPKYCTIVVNAVAPANSTLNVVTKITTDSGGPVKSPGDVTITVNSPNPAGSNILAINPGVSPAIPPAVSSVSFLGKGTWVSPPAALQTTSPDKTAITIKGGSQITITPGVLTGYTSTVFCDGIEVGNSPIDLEVGAAKNCTVLYDDVAVQATAKLRIANPSYSFINDDGGTTTVLPAGATFTVSAPNKIASVSNIALLDPFTSPADLVRFPVLPRDVVPPNYRDVVLNVPARAGVAQVTISASNISGYTAYIDCSGTNVGNPSSDLVIAEASTKACSVRYNDIKPKLKVVNNVGAGGPAPVPAFTLKVDTTTVTSGQLYSFAAGAHTVTITTAPNYSSVFDAGCLNGAVTLVTGALDKTCTITTTYAPPTGTLKVITVVNNVSAEGELGFKQEGNFLMSVEGVGVSPNGKFVGMATPGKTVTLSPGAYNVKVDNDPEYLPTFSDNCLAPSSINAGETKTCTVTLRYTNPGRFNYTFIYNGGPVTEGDTVVVTVKLSRVVPAGLAVNMPIYSSGVGVPPATSPADFPAIGTITFPAGTDTATFNFSPVDDGIMEGDEVAKFNPDYAGKIGGYNLVGTFLNKAAFGITIKDKIVPLVNIDVLPLKVLRGGFAQVTASWPVGTAVQNTNVTFPVTFGGQATLDDDYTVTFLENPALPNTMIMPAGKSSAITMIIIANKKVVADETLTINVSNVAKTITNSKTVTLVNAGEGDCNSEIFGQTDKSAESQVDHGITYFDTYTGSGPGAGVDGYVGGLANLSILGQELGYAPLKEQAACVSKPSNTDTYELHGYAWNDNLGFLSFYCSEASGLNLGIECGPNPYGVTVEPKGSAPKNSGDLTKRKLTGYGWNATFGYISFSGNVTGGGTYGVTAENRAGTNYWDLSGYGWTQAGVYMNFKGTTVELLPMAVEECVSGVPPYPCCLSNAAEFPECAVPPVIPLADCDLVTDQPAHDCCVRAANKEPLPDECTTISPLMCTIDFEKDGELDSPTCCANYPDAELTSGGSCNDNPPYCKPPFNKGKGLCMLPFPDPTLVNYGSLENLPYANCTQGYAFDLYLTGENGEPRAYDNDAIYLGFTWKDTVKLDQVDPIKLAGNWSNLTSPWKISTGGGGVYYKPLEINVSYNPATKASNFEDYFDKVYKDNGVVPTGPVDTGHYRLKDAYKVKSCAPTSGGNVSEVKTIPEAVFDNEIFLGMKNLWATEVDEVLTRKSEPNNLVLINSNSVLMDKNGDPVSWGNIIADQKPIYLKFKPAIEVKDLYTTDLVDAITANRDIPFDVKMTVSGDNGFVTEAGNSSIKLNLAYDTDGKPVDSTCTSALFRFDIGGANAGVASCDNVKLKGANCVLKYLSTFGESTLTLTPKLPDGSVAVCPKMIAPAIYSTVEYSKAFEGNTHTVKYYSNKLPKIDGSFLDNMAAIIHGTILSSMQFSTDITQTYSPVGDVVSNVVRDTVHRNVAEYVKTTDEAKALVNGSFARTDLNRCIITKMTGVGDSAITTVPGCDDYHNAELIGLGTGEKVDYFKGVNVVLGEIDGEEAKENSIKSIGKRVIVVEGGDLLINKNVYDETDGSQLVIVVMGVKQDDGIKGGNVYIADNVTTLSNVAIVADGSVHPFPVVTLGSPIFDKLEVNGELKNIDIFYKGEHKNDGYQLFIKGAISAKTVAGIANTVQKTASGTHYLRGTNEAIDTAPDAIFKSMFFDWNAFRYYKGGDFTQTGGLIKDWSCGANLSFGDYVAIANGGEICGVIKEDPLLNGAYSSCTTCATFTNRCQCDGIQATVNVHTGQTGDLIRNPDKESPLSRSYKPFYLYYVPINSAILNAEGK